MKPNAPVVLAALLVASASRADVMPPGSKGVKNSIAIEGSVPAGRALVVANTFYGATRAKVGAPTELAYHPLQGPMRLVMVPEATAAKVPEVGTVDKREELEKLTKDAVGCSEPFSGTRTIVETEPADEIRLVFHVDATATTCAAKLVRTEYFAKDGAKVAGPVGSASASAPAPSGSASAGAATDSPPTPAANASRAGCGACTIGGESVVSPSSWWGLLVAGSFLLRRRRRPG